MIEDTVSRRNNPAITSDRWHVVHARWTGDAFGEPRFERSIVSEHDDSASAVAVAREVLSPLARELANREPAQRDQVFVRRPGFKSLRLSKRVEPRGRRRS